MDTLVHRKEDGSTKVSIYRKPTHTDQYLDWNSNHHISQKTGIYKTFQHRINTLITEEEDKEAEKKHVKKALRKCGHPNWSMNRKDRPQKEKMETITKVSIPYTKGTSERLSRTFRQYKIGVIHKPTTTIKRALCSKLKDKIHPMDKSNAIYRFDCKKCDKIYIGETERSLRYRAYEHKMIARKEAKTAHSLIKTHKPTQHTGHQTAPPTRPRRNTNRPNYAALHSGANETWNETPDSYTEIGKHIREDHTKEDYTFKLITTEEGCRKRTLKEALMIQKEDPSRLLNENMGKHTYSHIYQLRRTNPTAEKSAPITDSNDDNTLHQAQQTGKRPPQLPVVRDIETPTKKETQVQKMADSKSVETSSQLKKVSKQITL